MVDPGVATEPSSQDGILRIGERQYPISGLSDDCKRLLMAIKDSEDQTLQLKRQVNYLEIARRSLVQELLQLLPAD